MNIELHPLCTLFPRLSGAEFDALCDDIKSNGLRQPIVLHEGMILDGGNRYRACIEAGVEPEFAPFDGGNLVSFVLSANLHRRHMTPGQQAAIVASAQDWAQAQTRGGDRGNQHTGGKGSADPLATAQGRARLSGASVETQKRADKVARADPALAKEVAQGTVSLPAAVEQITGKRPGAKAKDTERDSFGGAKTVPPKKRKPAPDPAPRDELEDAVQALAEENERLMAENDTLRRAADPDAVTKISQLKAYINTVESQRDDWMNQCAMLKREVKRLHRQLGVVHAA